MYVAGRLREEEGRPDDDEDEHDIDDQKENVDDDHAECLTTTHHPLRCLDLQRAPPSFDPTLSTSLELSAAPIVKLPEGTLDRIDAEMRRDAQRVSQSSASEGERVEQMGNRHRIQDR